MDQLLRLNTSFDTLSNQEFKGFMDTIDKKTLTLFVFNHFQFQLKKATILEINNRILPEIQKLNNQIADIIRSREDESQDVEGAPFEATKFDGLPSSIISHISSFMNFDGLIKFEKCNKHIFIAARLYTSLSTFCSPYSGKLIKYVRQTGIVYHWNRFKSIHGFEMNIEACFTTKYHGVTDPENVSIIYHCNLQTMPFWSQLKRLIIYQEREYVDGLGIESKMESFPMFTEDLQVQLKNSNLITFKDETYWQLGQYLLLNNIDFVYSHRMRGDMTKMCQLKGIGGNEGGQDITINGHKMESIHFGNGDMRPLIEKEVKLDNLKEICIVFSNKNDIDFLNKQKLDKLERIHIHCHTIDDSQKRKFKSFRRIHFRKLTAP